eukprot:CAMPEP_0176075630 /NCGR_PEP_ID=MMETSP0120_2-20121206/37802_1 /TAXON_ID=160619 /ORGANISM="Kryptoperidinium foliaceum, Strain CCMP 1326" /LENGTH=480 /DNA_ID=CAMNT_0017409337 /DNA_START=58 /DNA_END=1497 /DNA_ORIENTATION=+
MANRGYFDGDRGERLRLGLCAFFLLASSVGNQIYFKKMTSAMPNYGWYLTQLSTFIYVPIFAVVAGTGAVQHAKPGLLFKFAMMGVFDGLSGTMMVLGGVHTSGTMQVLLSQAVIPMTIVFSVALLRKRYHLLQHSGAAIIVVGIILAKAAGGGGDAANNLVTFNIIFACSLVPSALSSVFKEVAFKGFDGDLDVNVLQFWVALFQFVTNFIAMPIYTLPVLGPQQVPMSHMPALITGGTRCLFFLEDQVKMDCGWPGERPCDHCATAWLPVVLYLAFNVLFNIFTILVIKHGSAALSFLIATLRMPLAAFAFGSPLIMGREAVPPGPKDIVCLVVIIAGLVTYRYGGVLLQRQEPEEFASPGSPDESPSPGSSSASPSSLREPLKRPRRLKWAFLPLFNTGGVPTAEPAFIQVRAKVAPRSAVRVRHDLYHKLGAASPWNSPQYRHLSPPPSPNPHLAASEDSQLPEPADFSLTGLAQS